MRLWWCEFKYYHIHRNLEKLNMFIGKHLPKEWRRWSLVHATCKACGDTKSPCEVNYKEIYKAI